MPRITRRPIQDDPPHTRRGRRAPAPEPEPAASRRSRRVAAPPAEETPPSSRRRGSRTAAPAARGRGSRDYGPSRDAADDDADGEYYDNPNKEQYADEDRVDPSEAEVGGAGWGASTKYREEARTGSGVDRITIDIDETIVGFFYEAEPFNSYVQRWVDPAGRSFVGLKDDDPLEKLGVEGKPYSAFNFVPLGSTKDERDVLYEDLKVWVLQASKSLVKELEPAETARGSRALPLNADDIFYEIRYYKQDNGWGAYEAKTITGDQLREYWQMEPPTEREIDALADECFVDEDYPSLPSRAEVEAAAAKLMEADRRSRRRGR